MAEASYPLFNSIVFYRMVSKKVTPHPDPLAQRAHLDTATNVTNLVINGARDVPGPELAEKLTGLGMLKTN